MYELARACANTRKHGSVLNEITFNSSRAESGSITGLNEREWGHIGVKSMQGTFGCTCKIEGYHSKMHNYL